MQPSQRPRFVSGKFVWDYDGHKLVKDAGKHAIATFHLEREKSATQPQIKLLSLLLGKYRSSLGTDNLHGLALFRLLILMNNDKQAHTHTHAANCSPLRLSVQDQGGFFIGTSPEWQLAIGTVAYFETSTPGMARQNGWIPWTGAYDEGYTKEHRWSVATSSGVGGRA